MRSSPAGLVAVVLVLGAAFAAPARALEAEQLRSKIEEVFALTEVSGGPGAPPPYGYDSIEVEPRGEGFRVTVAGFRVLMDPAEAGQLVIGDAAFTMTPAGQDGGEEVFQVSDLSVPPSWHYAVGDDPPSHLVKPGPVAFEGLWSFAYLSLMEAELSAAGVRIESPAGELLSSVETVLAELETRPADKGRYDVDAKLRADGIEIRDGQLHMSLGGIASEVEVPGHDPAAAVEVLRAAARSKASSPEAAEAASSSLMADILYLSEGGRMSFELSDIRAVWSGVQEALEIDAIELQYTVSNLEESVAKLDMAVAQTGLRITAPDRPDSRLSAALMPADSGAVLSVERLPLRTLLALLEPLAEEAAAVEGAVGDSQALGGRNGDELAAEAGEKLIGAMSDAGTTLDLSGTRLAAPEAEITFKGGMVIDAAAAFGMRGSLLAEFFGFDALVELAQLSLEDPDPRIQDTARSVVGFVALLQAFAQRDETAPGGPVDRFLFKVERNGAVWINDKPLLPPQPSH